MKSLIKQVFYTSLLVISLIVILGFIIPFVAKQLSIYEITYTVVSSKSTIILIGVILHFLCGFYMFKTKLFQGTSIITVILVFLFFYIGFTSMIRISRGESLTYFELELSLIAGLILGYLLHKFKTIFQRVGSIIILVLLIAFTNYYTIPFTNQKGSYNNYDGKSNMRKVKYLALYNGKGEIKKIHNQESKIVVIDFWNNTCAICFKKFPKYIEFQKQYVNNPTIEIIALNVFEEKKEIIEGEKLLEQTKNQDLINYYISKDSISIFNVSRYPKVVVIKNNRITFEGNLETLLLYKDVYLE